MAGHFVAKADAHQNYQQSLADYHACLDANPTNAQACQGKRPAMEADERAFNDISASVQPGRNATRNIIFRGR
jgi:hypothetical protein